MGEWQPIETAPKDGTAVLLGGRWRPYDILPGGGWCQIIAAWTTLSSNLSNADYYWMSDLNTLDHWNVDFTHWHALPAPPTPTPLEERG